MTAPSSRRHVLIRVAAAGQAGLLENETMAGTLTADSIADLHTATISYLYRMVRIAEDAHKGETPRSDDEGFALIRGRSLWQEQTAILEASTGKPHTLLWARTTTQACGGWGSDVILIGRRPRTLTPASDRVEAAWRESAEAVGVSAEYFADIAEFVRFRLTRPDTVMELRRDLARLEGWNLSPVFAEWQTAPPADVSSLPQGQQDIITVVREATGKSTTERVVAAVAKRTGGEPSIGVTKQYLAELTRNDWLTNDRKNGYRPGPKLGPS